MGEAHFYGAREGEALPLNEFIFNVYILPTTTNKRGGFAYKPIVTGLKRFLNPVQYGSKAVKQ